MGILFFLVSEDKKLEKYIKLLVTMIYNIVYDVLGYAYYALIIAKLLKFLNGYENIFSEL